jgi:acetylornithine/succinyldiaminopimelate/putrescine aminotransferase
LSKSNISARLADAPAGARECVRFLPPLNVKAAEIDEALEKLEGSLQEVFKSDSKTG